MKSDRFNCRSGLKKRITNIRNERTVPEELPHTLVFSFKDFDVTQIPPGQSFADWEETGNLSQFLEELRHLSSWTVTEAQQNGILTVYKHWPPNSEFKLPKNISPDVNWAVLKSVGGQKIRVAGHVIGNVFHIVFLDKNHVFWKMSPR